MKRILYFTLAAAATLLLFSCSKDSSVKPGNGSSETVKNSVTISVDIPKEGLSTKISFAEDGDKRLTKIAWEDDDVIDVYDGTTHIPFTIVPASISADGKTATFTGNEPAVASSYVITYNSLSSLNTQMQNGDGTTDHLGYKVVKTVSDYKTVSFAGATTQSSVLQLRALLPDAIKNNVTKVIFKSNLAVFNGQKELSVALADGKLDANDRLDVYASIPEGDITLPDDMELLIQFQVSANAYDKYTAYRTFTSGTELFQNGGSQYIGINCSNIESYANASNASIGSSTNPYLVGDQHQMQKIKDEMAAGETKYFKLVDDIDMTGVSWTKLNPDPFTKVINLDGNNKVVSNLGASMFADLNGTVANLTIESATVSGGSAITGILANTIKTAASTVANVDINASSVTASGYTGGLIGQIDATNTSVSDCDVTNTNVSGTLAGGVIGFANALVSMSGCNYSGGTVSASARFCGGMLGSAANHASVISDCHVENATIKTTRTDDARCGGFVGQLQAQCQVKGCTVGTSTQKVIIDTPSPADGKVLNSGGFVGVNYGTITKNGDARSQAYVQVKSTNTVGQQLNLGGFAGYHTGTIEYSDADVDMANLQGQYIGGFIGYIASNGARVDHCTVTGSVRGNNYTGMFLGHTDKSAIITNNTASGTVTGQSSAGGFVGYCDGGATFEDNSTSAALSVRGSNAGGFAGGIENATLTRCSATGTVTKIEGTGNVMGGFAGYTNNAFLDGCFATGAVNSNALSTEYVGGFIGQVKPADSKQSDIRNCYASGAVTGQGRWVGGFIGYIFISSPGTVFISKCHASGDVTSTGNYCGGFVGRILMTTNVTIEKSYATGSVSSTGSYRAGFIGDIDGESASHTISDCYATGAVNIQNTRYSGGFFAAIQKNPTSVTVSRCYAANAVSGTFEVGGMIGRTNAANFTIEDCAAWNPSVSASSHGQTNWSSGPIIGVTHPNGHARNNFRNPDMALQIYCVPDPDFDQPDIDGTTSPLYWNSQTAPFTWSYCTATSISAGTSNVDAGRWAYHGKHSPTSRLSTLASTVKASGGLGWSSDVWDFTGDLPTLK